MMSRRGIVTVCWSNGGWLVWISEILLLWVLVGVILDWWGKWLVAILLLVCIIVLSLVILVRISVVIWISRLWIRLLLLMMLRRLWD
jgi:hypothetical protein